MNEYIIQELNNPNIDLEDKKFQWIISDVKKVLFKINSTKIQKRPCFAEKISNDIAKELEMEVPRTEVVKLNGKLGILSFNFLKENERFITADQFTKSNNVKQIIIDLNNKLSTYNITQIEKQQIVQKFTKMVILDHLVSNTDRHNKNWGLIELPDNKVKFVPVFDFDHSLGLDNVLDDKKDYKAEIASQKQIMNAGDKKAIDYLMQTSEFARDFAQKAIDTITSEKIEQIVDRYSDEYLPAKYKNMAKQVLNSKIDELSKSLEFHKKDNGKNFKSKIRSAITEKSKQMRAELSAMPFAKIGGSLIKHVKRIKEKHQEQKHSKDIL